MRFNHVKDENSESVIIFLEDGDARTVSSSHANFSAIVDELKSETPSQERIFELIDVAAAIGTKLRNLSERVSLSGNTLYFDGDAVDSALSRHIVRMVKENNENYHSLVKFLEKLYTNPSKASRASLYTWLNGRDFTIASDGDFLAYKGVRVGAKGESLSVSSGKATVNGVVHSGHIPNPLGAVVEMPRSSVNDDTKIGCSTGLHAGTWKYAHDFARGRTLVVKINPRDVVSVPDDCNFQKLRVSRYTVLSAKDQPYQEPVWDDEADDYHDDDQWGEEEDYSPRSTA